jgi:hypothetical protein
VRSRKEIASSQKALLGMVSLTVIGESYLKKD